jgi:hypothetical protein
VSDSDKSKFSSVMFELFLIEYTVGRGLGIACNTLIVRVYQFCLLLRLFYFSGFGATLSDVLRFAVGFTHRRLKHEHEYPILEIYLGDGWGWKENSYQLC